MRTSLFCLLVVAALSLSAKDPDFAVENPDGITIYYNRTSRNTVEVTKKSLVRYSGYIDIPATIEVNGTNYTVTSIGVNAFAHCNSLTSIDLPNTITSIGRGAFESCTALTSIAIPNKLSQINESTFYYCTSLTSVTIPNSVTSIGAQAFCRCYSLQSIAIPNSVVSIGFEAFYGCDNLSKVYIPQGTPASAASRKYFKANQIAYMPASKFERGGVESTDMGDGGGSLDLQEGDASWEESH